MPGLFLVSKYNCRYQVIGGTKHWEVIECSLKKRMPKYYILIH